MKTTRSILGAVGLTVAVAVASGCSADGDERSQSELEPVPNTPATLEIEVGTGIENFEPLAENDPVNLTFGPQGGFHIWTSVRTRDTSVETAQINVSSRFVEDGTPAGPPSRWPAKLVLREGARDHTGMRNFIDDAPRANGKRLVLRAEVILSDGRHGEGETIVVPTFK